MIIFILFLIIANLGIYTDSWDARSIWIFKVKQIFFENSILYSKNNYAEFSHPDYPNIAPAFSAALVKLIGYWNEVFPKLGFTIMFLPPLFFLSKQFNNNNFLITLIFITFVVGKYFINGELDGLLSIYFVSCALIMFRISFESQNYDFDKLIFLSLAIILSLLKLEGLFLLLCLITSSILIMIINRCTNYKLILLSLISLTPILAWNYFCFYHKIDNTNSNYAYSMINLSNTIFNLDYYKLVGKYLIFNEKFILGLIFFISSITYFTQKKLLGFILLTCLIYISILFLVYLSTPLDIEWHLNSSANRVIKPMALLLFTFSVYNILKNK